MRSRGLVTRVTIFIYLTSPLCFTHALFFLDVCKQIYMLHHLNIFVALTFSLAFLLFYSSFRSTAACLTCRSLPTLISPSLCRCLMKAPWCWSSFWSCCKASLASPLASSSRPQSMTSRVPTRPPWASSTPISSSAVGRAGTVFMCGELCSGLCVGCADEYSGWLVEKTKNLVMSFLILYVVSGC